MNTIVTSKEEILEASRQLIREKGWPAVNIRSVAATCGVSVGSIYNYFDSKAALVGDTVESIWREIFRRPAEEAPFQDIRACVTWIYGRMAYGSRQYPGFFTLHSLGFLEEDRSDGKRRMEQTWRHIVTELTSVLKRDPGIRPEAFGPRFAAEQWADVLFSLILSALLRQDYDPATALELIHRTLYGMQGGQSWA